MLLWVLRVRGSRLSLSRKLDVGLPLLYGHLYWVLLVESLNGRIGLAAKLLFEYANSTLAGGRIYARRAVAIGGRITADAILVLEFLFNVLLTRIANVLRLVRNRR
jgi:hypothetical protein